MLQFARGSCGKHVIALFDICMNSTTFNKEVSHNRKCVCVCVCMCVCISMFACSSV